MFVRSPRSEACVNTLLDFSKWIFSGISGFGLDRVSPIRRRRLFWNLPGASNFQKGLCPKFADFEFESPGGIDMHWYGSCWNGRYSSDKTGNRLEVAPAIHPNNRRWSSNGFKCWLFWKKQIVLISSNPPSIRSCLVSCHFDDPRNRSKKFDVLDKKLEGIPTYCLVLVVSLSRGFRQTCVYVFTIYFVKSL